jgi:hypothetical protein
MYLMRSILKISLLVSAVFIIIIGLFLLIFNFNIINESILIFIVNLWPLTLIITGSLLFYDSFRKKRFGKNKKIINKEIPLNFDKNIKEMQFNLKFSYGDLNINPASDKIILKTERNDFLPDPVITMIDNETIPWIDIAVNTPILPSPVLLIHNWNLYCSKNIKYNFNIKIHEADILLNFEDITVESLKLKADLGNHKIIIGNKQNKFRGNIYSYSKKLSLILPQNVFTKIQLLNQFCRIDYPQGDFNRTDDGIFIYQADKTKTIEIIVDGPVNHLFIDIAE